MLIFLLRSLFEILGPFYGRILKLKIFYVTNWGMWQNVLASEVTILSSTCASYNSAWNGTPDDLNSSKQIDYRK